MLNDMDTIRNKANAREWTLTNTLGYDTAYSKGDLVIVFNFYYGKLILAKLYRSGKLIDSVYPTTVSKDTKSIVPSALYLLESL